MRLIYAMLLGFILDLIFGDPHGLIHPVQIIGWFIDKLKKGMQHMIYGCSYEEVSRNRSGTCRCWSMRKQPMRH